MVPMVESPHPPRGRRDERNGRQSGGILLMDWSGKGGLMQKSLFATWVLTAILLPLAGAAEELKKVLLRTEEGTIELELFPERAPKTVANFLAYVNGGYYSGGSFYRVVRPDNDNGSPKITVIQGGANASEDDPPFPPVELERTNETGISNGAGTIAMARGGPNSATHAVFINVTDNPGLDYGQERNADGQGFAAFGRVTSGMEVVRAINARTNTREDADAYVSGQMLDPPVKILDARQVEE